MVDDTAIIIYKKTIGGFNQLKGGGNDTMKKITLVAITITFVIATLCGAAALKNWQCKKCFTVVQKDSMPNTTTCPSGGGHAWLGLGEVGNDSYQCKKCGVIVKSKNIPQGGMCPQGYAHTWSKL